MVVNLQGDAPISRTKVSKMPQKVLAMSSIGHRTGITMRTRQVNVRFLITKFSVEPTPRSVHLPEV